MLVYHFINQEFGLDNLRHKRLKVATFNDLNDPFELLSGASANSEVRRAFRETKDELSTTVGLLCFSRNWSNPVQWSHYADKHRGMCLGFEIPDSNLVRVKYRRKRLKSDINALGNNDAAAETAMLDMLCTKYIHWQYEREKRVFVRLDERERDTRGLYFLGFSKTLSLKEVIIGHNCAIKRDELDRALGTLATRVTVQRARLSFLSFKVVKQLNEGLWKVPLK